MRNHFLRAIQKTSLPTYSYLGLYSDTVDRTTYSFTNCDIGTASSDRLVVVVIGLGYASGTASTQKASSVTINGVSATLATQSQDYSTTTGFGTTAIAYANVTAGTTGVTVTVTSNAGALRCLLSIYSLYGLQTLASQSVDGAVGAGGTNTLTDTVTTSVGSIVISGANSVSPNTGSDYIWTNVNEDYDTVLENARRYSAGSTQVTTSGNYNVTATRTSVSPNYFSIATASFR